MARKIASFDRDKSGIESENVYQEAPVAAAKASPEDIAEAARALQLIEGAQRHADVMSTVQDPVASLLQTYSVKFGGMATDGREVKFDERDVLGWASSLLTWVKRITKFKFADPMDLVGTFPNRGRVAVFGDWATGLYGAPEVAKAIAAEGNYGMLLHLGDTYYSGDDDEVEDGLVAPWPKVAGAVSRALNGNHEMYTGGEAYFNAINDEFGQSSTYFAVQNDHFILAGLDTAYADHDLHGQQAAWIGRLLAQANGRKLILFSHHQPYSLLDSQGPKLVAKLSPYLESKQIFAWYWGHEHRCVLYDKHPKWGLLGRCVGHGGFPAFRKDTPGNGGTATRFLRLPAKNLVPGGEVLDGPNPFITGHVDDYGPHGYASLEFDGPKVLEVIRSAAGEVLRKTELA